jgi:signal-transduction protein with cAMP-binding, CBS, and nucleotidyltransferase domain
MLQLSIFIKKILMDYNLLTKAPLFAGLSVEEIDYLLNKIPFKVKKYNSGSIVALCGEHVNALYLVMTGVVKGEMVDNEGRIIKIEDIPAPGALAAGFIFGRNNL